MFYKMSQIVIFLIMLLSLSCTNQNQPQSETAQLKANTQKVLNLYIWSNYISDSLLQDFQDKTGIKVVVTNYSSNEELLAKLQAGANGYDIIVPSDYMVEIMRKNNLLISLDKEQLTHFKNIKKSFLGLSFDPKNDFSVPYGWTISGIAINRDRTKDVITSWKDVFENPKLKGSLSLLDDTRETIGAALKMKGYSLNSTNPTEITQAKEILKKTKPYVKAFTSEPIDSISKGEFAVSHIYSQEAFLAKSKGANLDFIIPKEGAVLAIDNLAIPKGATHLFEAHQFINYLLDLKINAELVRTMLAGPVLEGVRELLPTQLKNDPNLFPSPELLDKCEMIQDLEDKTALYDQAWTSLKVSE